MIDLPFPLSINRYWTVSKHTRSIVPTAAGRKWKADMQMLAKRMWGKGVIEGPVYVQITLHPKTRMDGEANKQMPDLDNVCKVILDCLQGVCYANDRQIDVLLVQKGEPMQDGGVNVVVTSMQDFDDAYSKIKEQITEPA